MSSSYETAVSGVTLRFATREDVPAIFAFIEELADYERLAHEVVTDADQLGESLFGGRPVAEVVLAEDDGEAVGFALFFSNFSTFLGRSGIYLEDLFVRPSERGRGIGKAMLGFLAHLTVERGGGRLEWSVLDWNTPAIGFYENLGARAMNGWTVFRLTGPALEDLAADLRD